MHRFQLPEQQPTSELQYMHDVKQPGSMEQQLLKHLRVKGERWRWCVCFRAVGRCVMDVGGDAHLMLALVLTHPLLPPTHGNQQVPLQQTQAQLVRSSTSAVQQCRRGQHGMTWLCVGFRARWGQLALFELKTCWV